MRVKNTEAKLRFANTIDKTTRKALQRETRKRRKKNSN